MSAPLWGVVGVVVGFALKAAFDLLTENRRWRREDRLRHEDKRLEAYAALMQAAITLSTKGTYQAYLKEHGGDTAPVGEELTAALYAGADAIYRVHFLATPAVLEAAREYWQSTGGFVFTGEGAEVPDLDKIEAARGRFIDAVRAELGPDRAPKSGGVSRKSGRRRVPAPPSTMPPAPPPRTP